MPRDGCNRRRGPYGSIIAHYPHYLRGCLWITVAAKQWSQGVELFQRSCIVRPSDLRFCSSDWTRTSNPANIRRDGRSNTV